MISLFCFSFGKETEKKNYSFRFMATTTLSYEFYLEVCKAIQDHCSPDDLDTENIFSEFENASFV
jgi:hypothetical protein